MIDEAFAVPPFPTVINVETTNRCNLSCVICPRLTGMNRPVGDMEWALFRRVVDEVAAATPPGQPLAMGLHLFGEPLIHPDLLRQTAYARETLPRATLYLSTNVTLLRPPLATALASSGLDWIVLSLDGATARTYERVRRGARYAEAIAHVEGFLETLLHQPGRQPRVWIQLIAADEDLAGEVAEFRATWRVWEDKLPGVRVVVKPATDWAGQVALSGGFADKTTIPRPGKCRRVVDQLNVYWNGQITACCYDVDGLMTVGDLADQSLLEIWHGDQLSFLRETFRRGRQRRLPLCRTCEEAL